MPLKEMYLTAVDLSNEEDIFPTNLCTTNIIIYKLPGTIIHLYSMHSLLDFDFVIHSYSCYIFKKLIKNEIKNKTIPLLLLLFY